MSDQEFSMNPQVISINISDGGIPKYPKDSIQITKAGLFGDKHNHEKHYRVIQAVSIQDIEKLTELKEDGYDLLPGATGENLTVQNLNVNNLEVGALLKFSGGVVLKLSKVRKPCYVLDSIDPKLKEDIDGRCGMYAEVVKEGVLSCNEQILLDI
ncbi:hypothetical protein MNBD_BACTEROID05-751 [hydrothermal vent metagenome]|uniref:MOSC domain-containing protein n=1 Tax=hydrothermal vent metagenome TaxID=652676 RepID=A0A3B0TMM6_9ZZZZ